MSTIFPKKAETSEPPKPSRKNRLANLNKPARHHNENEVIKKPLQFKVSESLFNEFSARAHEDFGHQKGAKLDLFIEMWEMYKKL